MLRTLLHILISAAIFAVSAQELVILSMFGFNQEYIEANLCVNRTEVTGDSTSDCGGSCFLMEKLEEASTPDQDAPDAVIVDRSIEFFQLDECHTAPTSPARKREQLHATDERAEPYTLVFDLTRPPIV